jgi:hypothetical protein
MGSTEHWAVTVERNGEKIVTIESNCLSGRELSAEDEQTIRTAALHLLAFVGDPTQTTGIARDIADWRFRLYEDVAAHPDWPWSSLARDISNAGRITGRMSP